MGCSEQDFGFLIFKDEWRRYADSATPIMTICFEISSYSVPKHL